MPDLTDTGLLTSGRAAMSTMWMDTPRWLDEVDFYEPRHPGGPSDLLRLYRMARRHEVVIALGAVSLKHRYRDLVLAVLLKTVPARRRPRLVLAEATWEPKSRAIGRVTGLSPELFGRPFKLLVRLIAGPSVTFGVLSSEEVETFPVNWGVAPERVVFTRYPATLETEVEIRRGDYVFCGGDSLRDHTVFEEAVTALDVPVVMGTSWRPTRPDTRIRASYLPQVEYDATMAAARLVVVALLPSLRSAGQQTYLNAMLLGKPTIVSDTTGVRDYVEDGVTGVIVPPGDPVALRAAIADVLDPDNAERYEEMGRRARAAVLERHTPEHYWDHELLDAAGL